MDLQITPRHGNSSETGTFLDGARRIEMAAEVRHARSCSLCADRKAAPAPNVVAGAHDTRGHLGAGEVEV